MKRKKHNKKRFRIVNLIFKTISLKSFKNHFQLITKPFHNSLLIKLKQKFHNPTKRINLQSIKWKNQAQQSIPETSTQVLILLAKFNQRKSSFRLKRVKKSLILKPILKKLMIKRLFMKFISKRLKRGKNIKTLKKCLGSWIS